MGCVDRKNTIAYLDSPARRANSAQTGSIIVHLVIFASILGMASLAAMDYIKNQDFVNKREKNHHDKASLTAVASFLLNTPAACKANIIDAPAETGVGNLKAEIQNVIANPGHSSRNDIRLSFPAGGGAPASPVVAKDMEFGSLKIAASVVQSVAQRVAANRSYLALLRIDVTQRDAAGGDPSLKPVFLPFFVGTDAGGAVTSCFMTSVTDSGQTVEDALCLATKGVGFAFDPVGNKCFSI